MAKQIITAEFLSTGCPILALLSILQIRMTKRKKRKKNTKIKDGIQKTEAAVTFYHKMTSNVSFSPQPKYI